MRRHYGNRPRRSLAALLSGETFALYGLGGKGFFMETAFRRMGGCFLVRYKVNGKEIFFCHSSFTITLNNSTGWIKRAAC